MATILKGAPVAAALNEKTAELAKEVTRHGILPALAAVQVGEKPDDAAYLRSITACCRKAGVTVRPVLLPVYAGQAQIVETLLSLNADAAIHGILLMRPLPGGTDDTLIRNTIAPHKDVDGVTDPSLAGVFTGSGAGFPPCTAKACMEILSFYRIDPKGMRAAVLGRSLTVGKPAAMMLLAAGATVTVCHTKTQDPAKVCRAAELVIAAIGRAAAVGQPFFSRGQVVIDVGINQNEKGELCGDVDFEAAARVCAAVTPAPGGVGGVTSAVLASHVVKAAAGGQTVSSIYA